MLICLSDTYVLDAQKKKKKKMILLRKTKPKTQ